MNILYIVSSLNPGGAEKQTVTDANLFAKKHKVVLVTFKSGELEKTVDDRVKLIIIEKKSYLSAKKILREIIIEEKIQIINASLFASMILAVLSANKPGIPVLWYFHSHEYDIHLKSKTAFRYFSKKDCLKKIFFVSEELREYFSKNGFNFPEEKQDILYNNFTVGKNELKIKKNSSDELVIGYIGRLVELKRAWYLIELAGHLKREGFKNFRIDIVGDGILKQELIEYSKKLNVDDKVRFTGFQKDVEKYYEAFDIFALPSGEECLSISLIDACIKALPCVAFDIGGNNEILKNGKTGYLVKSKNEFFEKIIQLMNDDEKRKKIGWEAMKYCLDKFDIAKRTEYLENIFKILNIEFN